MMIKLQVTSRHQISQEHMELLHQYSTDGVQYCSTAGVQYCTVVKYTLDLFALYC